MNFLPRNLSERGRADRIQDFSFPEFDALAAFKIFSLSTIADV